jgi:hypothetical protein
MFADITIKELDEFFSHIDFIPTLPFDHPWAHMTFRTPYDAKKKKRLEEMTPMYRFRGQLISAQRMSLVLFRKTDPVYKARIQTVCNMPECVNPEHLYVVEKHDDDDTSTDMESVF